MSYALVKYDFPGGNVKPLCEYAIETASDLTSLPATDISPNSVAITPNGALYRLSVSGDWVFDTSTYGGSADLLGELPHVLNLSQGDNSTLVVKKLGSPVSDGDLVYYGDVLNVEFAPATGYDVVCTVNGTAVETTGYDFTVPLGGDVSIATVAAIKMLKLTLTQGDNTTIEVTSGSGEDVVTYSNGDYIAYGTELTITAEAGTGYDLSTFTVGGVTKASPATHTITADVEVVTEAALKTYTLSITQGENTTVTVTDEDEEPVLHGATISHFDVLTITATADEGYTLSTFTINAEDATSPAEHVVDGNVAIVTAATQNE
jgi:hypothetical protein